ncbi:hypothetical protein C3L33_18957, partial [Rhododendron williamsianum]
MFPVGLGFVIGFFILLLYWASPLIQNWKIVLLTFYLVVRFGISNESNCLIVIQMVDMGVDLDRQEAFYTFGNNNFDLKF